MIEERIIAKSETFRYWINAGFDELNLNREDIKVYSSELRSLLQENKVTPHFDEIAKFLIYQLCDEVARYSSKHGDYEAFIKKVRSLMNELGRSDIGDIVDELLSFKILEHSLSIREIVATDRCRIYEIYDRCKLKLEKV